MEGASVQSTLEDVAASKQPLLHQKACPCSRNTFDAKRPGGGRWREGDGGALKSFGCAWQAMHWRHRTETWTAPRTGKLLAAFS